VVRGRGQGGDKREVVGRGAAEAVREDEGRAGRGAVGGRGVGVEEAFVAGLEEGHGELRGVRGVCLQLSLIRFATPVSLAYCCVCAVGCSSFVRINNRVAASDGDKPRV